ncbi:hypothetical protein KAJ83_17835 [Marivibrio halodurans]|uniref:Peptidase C45 hydrolase domain-containing protein n=1 Tax=Marivibrio halodurans TaxID=2039722 RepID=A0A8J7V3Z0_9PROT|nr:hypothetical protein [Marivibrio halodurans]
MELTFQALEIDKAGRKWATLFAQLWPAYRRWYLSDGLEQRPTYVACRDAIAAHMPELLQTYERLCDWAGGGDLAARFLSLWKPPAYISGCSQVVWLGERPLLIRNYDYAPALSDGLIMKTRFGRTSVLAMTDCMWGVLDGVNERGLAISLTFGGRKTVGPGFGIPLILRYVLETCSTVAQATETLSSIPTHMAYNVTVVDRGGRFATAYLAPDRKPVVKAVAYATNHQGRIEWHDHARATATLEREQFLHFRINDPDMTEDALIAAFAKPPLYTNAYRTGFGTIYTAVYDPVAGTARFIWPDGSWDLSVDGFAEGRMPITFQSGTRAVG